MRALKILLAASGIAAAVLLGGVGWLVYDLLHPARQSIDINPADSLLLVEEVEFSAADGVPLRGWYVKGRQRVPGIVLCHPMGTNRVAVMNLVVPLQKAGYHVLLFDFRGHGQSGGSASTLGGDEAQDVMAALDFLAKQEGVDGKRLGGWGRGVGAYALALAARERTQLRALALDSLFSEPRAVLAEKLFPGTGLLEAPLSWIAAQEFRWLFGLGSATLPLSAVLPELGERSFFLVVSRDEPRKALAARTLLEQIPEGKDGEKNLLELEAAWSQNLYGEDRERYEREVRRFFLRALPLDGRSSEDSSPLHVLEG
jgi:hypothetical protein